LSSELVSFLKDAENFANSHGSIIERAPLQIYGSALVFSPASSEIRRKHWNERLSFIKNVNGIKPEWDVQQVLEGHIGEIDSVTFSPDGTVIASTSAADGTMRLWDAISRTAKRIIKCSVKASFPVVFFPDSKTVTLASDDGRVRLYHIATGTSE
jgi:WD40 repeat protein